jgi:hypothetical protein
VSPHELRFRGVQDGHRVGGAVPKSGTREAAVLTYGIDQRRSETRRYGVDFDT